MKSISRFLFSPALMFVLLLVTGTSLGVATFLENDYGSAYARLMVYNTRWMEIIFVLLAINLVGRIVQKKTYKRKTFSVFIYHLAFVIMLLGAAVTRYFGVEGMMHIREGAASSTVQTSENHLVLTAGKQQRSFPVDFAMEGAFDETLTLNGNEVNVVLKGMYRNVIEQAKEVDNGIPMVQFIMAGKTFRGSVLMREGEVKTFGNTTVSFNNPAPADLSIYFKNGAFFAEATSTIFSFPMDNAEEAHVSNDTVLLTTQTLYKVFQYNILFEHLLPSAEIMLVETGNNPHAKGKTGYVFDLSYGQNPPKEIVLWEEYINTDTLFSPLGETQLGLFYGRKTFQVPFSLHLNNFKIDRYPGSNSPSSFASEVTLYETGKEPMPYLIYMNNILKHRGYRFFQSSYDADERGTILSVNYDWAGTYITYIGYFLLTLGIVLSLVNKHSFFRKTVVSDKLLTMLLCLALGTVSAKAADQQTQPSTQIDAAHAEKFGQLLVQNNKGRTEPMYTLTSELFRKISRSEKMLEMTATQLFLEMTLNPAFGVEAPLIKVSNNELKEQLHITGKHAAFSRFVVHDSIYMLQRLVDKTYAIPPAQRTKYDKEILKVDEKINLCYAIFNRDLLRIFPVSDTESESWKTPGVAHNYVQNKADSTFLATVFPRYLDALSQAKQNGDYTRAEALLQQMIDYQQQKAAYTLPSGFKTQLEVYYYKWNVFKKLFPLYALLGVLMIFVLIGFIISGKEVSKNVQVIFDALIGLAFTVQTLGIAARWIISGHAPMSNGYESMIFIAWVTIGAGFLFRRYSSFTLPATAVLAALTLMVANLSFMDPQITNLVPVLQSYWLTLHVSIITGSYGFLALGMLLGLINMVLLTLRTAQNRLRINDTLLTLTVINHKTLIVGLYLLTIGTFLGAVWANESWGRYWGWDPKETWALISIIVYTIITHARYIPGLKGVYAYNALSVVGFSAILMTYFGVNYYLSGMHSYAAGDSVPVPVFVYYVVGFILVLLLASYFNYIKMSPLNNKRKKQ